MRITRWAAILVACFVIATSSFALARGFSSGGRSSFSSYHSSSFHTSSFHSSPIRSMPTRSFSSRSQTVSGSVTSSPRNYSSSTPTQRSTSMQPTRPSSNYGSGTTYVSHYYSSWYPWTWGWGGLWYGPGYYGGGYGGGPGYAGFSWGHFMFILILLACIYLVVRYIWRRLTK